MRHTPPHTFKISLPVFLPFRLLFHVLLSSWNTRPLALHPSVCSSQASQGWRSSPPPPPGGRKELTWGSPRGREPLPLAVTGEPEQAVLLPHPREVGFGTVSVFATRCAGGGGRLEARSPWTPGTGALRSQTGSRQGSFSEPGCSHMQSQARPPSSLRAWKLLHLRLSWLPYFWSISPARLEAP